MSDIDLLKSNLSEEDRALHVPVASQSDRQAERRSKRLKGESRLLLYAWVAECRVDGAPTLCCQ